MEFTVINLSLTSNLSYSCSNEPLTPQQYVYCMQRCTIGNITLCMRKSSHCSSHGHSRNSHDPTYDVNLYTVVAGFLFLITQCTQQAITWLQYWKGWFSWAIRHQNSCKTLHLQYYNNVIDCSIQCCNHMIDCSIQCYNHMIDCSMQCATGQETTNTVEDYQMHYVISTQTDVIMLGFHNFLS